MIAKIIYGIIILIGLILNRYTSKKVRQSILGQFLTIFAWPIFLLIGLILPDEKK